VYVIYKGGDAMKVSVSLSLPLELAVRLEEEAKRSSKTRNELLAEALDKYLPNKGEDE
jgi:predicted DNA-binding protein